MQLCVDQGSACGAIVLRNYGTRSGPNFVYEGRSDAQPSTWARDACPNAAGRNAFGGWAGAAWGYHCISYAKVCLPPSPLSPPPPPGGVQHPPPPSSAPPPPPSAGAIAPLGIPGCRDRCCVVIYNGGPGRLCTPVPVWDLSSWHHPGGSFVQSSRLCGTVRHNWLLRSPRHPIMFDSQTALPQQGQALFGGGFRVGQYIDPACDGMIATAIK